MSSPYLKITIHSQTAEQDGFPGHLSDTVVDAVKSEPVDAVVPGQHPLFVNDDAKNGTLPTQTIDTLWTAQFNRFQRFAERTEAEWELIGFDRSTSDADHVGHNSGLPDPFLTVLERGASAPPHSRIADIRGVFPAVVSGREYTCVDVLEVFAGDQDWVCGDSGDLGVTPSGIRAHDNWRDRLVDSWHHVIGEGDWMVEATDYTFTESNDTGGTGHIDLVMRRRDRTEYYLVDVKPDATQQEELDRVIGQAMRYRELFQAETADEDLDASAIHSAVALPDVPEPYRHIADRLDIALIDVPSALDVR